MQTAREGSRTTVQRPTAERKYSFHSGTRNLRRYLGRGGVFFPAWILDPKFEALE